MRTSFIKPNEFLAVSHSALNGNSCDISMLVDETLDLGKHTNGRDVVPCFEGDIVQIKETGEVVLTHKNFTKLTFEKYEELRDMNIATLLKEVLDNVCDYRSLNDCQRIVLCFELKNITSDSTIDKTIRLLREYGISNVYFDSFFGGRLDAVNDANHNNGVNFLRSLHLLGNFFKGQLVMSRPKKGYDFLTCHAITFGNVGEPAIYGGVGSIDRFKKISEIPGSIVAYVRFREGSGIRGALLKLKNSWRSKRELY